MTTLSRGAMSTPGFSSSPRSNESSAELKQLAQQLTHALERLKLPAEDLARLILAEMQHAARREPEEPTQDLSWLTLPATIARENIPFADIAVQRLQAPDYAYMKLAEAEEGLEKETEMATGENAYKMLGWVLLTLKEMRDRLRGSDNSQAELEIGNTFFLKVIEPVLKTEGLEGSINPRASDFWNACETLLRLLGQRGDLQLQLRENDEVDNDAADAAESALRQTDAEIAVCIQEILALMNEQYEMLKDVNNRAAAVAGFEVERRELMHETSALLAQCEQDGQNNAAEQAQLEYTKQMTNEEYQGHVKATQTAVTGVRESKAACVADLEEIAVQMAALAIKAKEKYKMIDALNNQEAQLAGLAERNKLTFEIRKEELEKIGDGLRRIAEDVTARKEAIKTAQDRGAEILDALICIRNERQIDLEEEKRSMLLAHYQQYVRIFEYYHMMHFTRQSHVEELEEQLLTLKERQKMTGLKDMFPLRKKITRQLGELALDREQKIAEMKELSIEMDNRHADCIRTVQRLQEFELKEHGRSAPGFAVMRRGKNILKNPEFEDLTQNWHPSETADISVSAASNASTTQVCTVRCIASSHLCGLRQDNVVVESDTSYLVSVQRLWRSTEGDVKVMVTRQDGTTITSAVTTLSAKKKIAGIQLEFHTALGDGPVTVHVAMESASSGDLLRVEKIEMRPLERLEVMDPKVSADIRSVEVQLDLLRHTFRERDERERRTLAHAHALERQKEELMRARISNGPVGTYDADSASDGLLSTAARTWSKETPNTPATSTIFDQAPGVRFATPARLNGGGGSTSTFGTSPGFRSSTTSASRPYDTAISSYSTPYGH